MSHPLVERVNTYPNKRVITHAKDIYCWDMLTPTEQASNAVAVLKYAADAETIINQFSKETV